MKWNNEGKLNVVNALFFFFCSAFWRQPEPSSPRVVDPPILRVIAPAIFPFLLTSPWASEDFAVARPCVVVAIVGAWERAWWRSLMNELWLATMICGPIPIWCQVTVSGVSNRSRNRGHYILMILLLTLRRIVWRNGLMLRRGPTVSTETWGCRVMVGCV